MSRSKAAGSRRRGRRTCRKHRPHSRKPRQGKPAYRHPLANAMFDLLGDLLQETKRVGKRGHKLLWTPLLVSFCVILMSWDPSPSLAARFDAAGVSLSLLLPQHKKGATYQGLIKALQQRNINLHQRVADRLRQVIQQMATEAGCWLREGWCALTSDGSKFNCTRTAANEQAFGCASKKGKGQGLPQQLLTLLWHMGTGLPWAWATGDARASERELLRSMLPLLPIQALLVADAGFVGYEFLQAIADSQRHFLIRIGSNVALLRKLGFYQEQQDTVYLWPNKPTHRRKKPPMVLRLIRLQEPGKKTVYLLTNELDPSKLSIQSAQVLYTLRWGVEVFFRSLKQTLCRRKLLCDAPDNARQELYWAVIGIAVLGVLSVREILAAGKDPLSFSVALALASLRHAAQSTANAAADLTSHLSAAVKDSYRRLRPKHSRNWPRRKRCKPPGRPQLRQATKTEINMAQTFHRKSVVNQFTA